MGKTKVYVVFSKEGAEAVTGGFVENAVDFLDNCPYDLEDCVKIREFDTEGERKAYLQALDDFDGFMDFATLDPQCEFDQTIINEIDKRYV